MPDHEKQIQADLERVGRIALRVVLLVVALAVIAWLLYALRAVLLLLAFSIIFCYLIAPLVDLVERPLRFKNSGWQMPRALAISIVYLLLIGLIVLAMDQVVPLLSEQLSTFWDNMPGYARQLDQYVKSFESLPNRYRLPPGWRQSVMDWISTTKVDVVQWVRVIANSLVRLALALPWLILIPIIGFFFLKDAKDLSQKFLLSLPEADMRYRLTIFLKEVSQTLAAYVRAQLIACLLVGMIEGAGLWLLGLRYPLVFAVAAVFFEFVPIVGPVVLGATAILVASFHSWQSALIIASFLAIYRIIHDYVIYPRLLSEGVEIHPVAVILAVLCGAELGGVTGVFLSVPVVALLIVCWRHWRDLRLDRANLILAPDGKQIVESMIVESIIVEE
ncbi:MAG: AI-2E family transporter [Acidobacteriota bacterium]